MADIKVFKEFNEFSENSPKFINFANFLKFTVLRQQNLTAPNIENNLNLERKVV